MLPRKWLSYSPSFTLFDFSLRLFLGHVGIISCHWECVMNKTIKDLNIITSSIARAAGFLLLPLPSILITSSLVLLRFRSLQHMVPSGHLNMLIMFCGSQSLKFLQRHPYSLHSDPVCGFSPKRNDQTTHNTVNYYTLGSTYRVSQLLSTSNNF